MTEIKSGKLVDIGEELVDDNEYIGDKLTTFTENGKVYAGTTGIVKIDKKNRKIKIETYNDEKRIIPRVGDWVIGTVDYIRKFSLEIEVHVLNNRLLIEGGIYGNVHISKASSKYVKKLEDLYQKNDIVRAKIIGRAADEWRLALNIPKTGVIYSECKFCGHTLKRVGHEKLLCPFCENTERKVLAPDYGESRTKIVY